MDQKILKQSLKEAKEAIKNGKYSEAIKLCKAILREERNNYMALVLFGAALTETEQKAQAPNAYKKAIENNPNHPLAWQGLMSFYEKDDSVAGKVELLVVYEKLISLESDATKIIELTNKLAQAAQRQGQIDTVVSALLSQQAVLEGDNVRLLDNWCRIASILSSSQQLTVQQFEQLENALPKIINNTSTMENMENIRKYLQTLHKLGKLELLAEWCRKAQNLFPKAEFPMEWACKAYTEYSSDSSEQLNQLFPTICDDLLVLNKNSGLAMLGRGKFLQKHGKFVEARDILLNASKALPTNIFVWELLAKCNLRLYTAEDAEQCVAMGMKLLADTSQKYEKTLQSSFDYMLLRALSESKQQDKLLSAVSKCEKILQDKSNDLEALECLAYACLSLSHLSEAELAIKSIVEIEENSELAVSLQSLLLVQKGDQTGAAMLLEKGNVRSENSSKTQLYAKVWCKIGNCYWQNSNHDTALPFFLKAAKVDSLYYLPFVQLAEYYRLYGNDLERARRCYQKAFHLNPRCEKAGIGLSDIYHTQNNTDANMDLLTSSAKNGIGGKWVWLRLGLLHLQMGNTDEAINQLLATLRTDPSNSLCWESLADAYLIRGSFTAAIKSFQKVLELNPNALYASIQIANVKLLLGQLVEAEEEFKLVLESFPDYVPALKGLGETYLYQAREYLTQQLIGRARDKCETALTILTSAAKLQRDIVCVWKLMGDASFLPSLLGSKSYLEVCSSLMLGDSSQKKRLVKLDCLQLLQLATRCYCCALSLDKEDSLAWHDLAMSYRAQAKFSSEPEELLKKALSAAHQACQLEPSNSEHWNLVGVIAADTGLKQYKLAQHALIKAVQIYSGNVEAWTNLGTLYLILGDTELAHQAYAAAQRTEPSYVECWIGQALIAETVGHADCMDLFRHATQLATHPESSLGYAYWVCSSFTKQNDSHKWKQSLAVAADELTWYTVHRSGNSCAYNLLGLLLERQGLLRSAAETFEKALNVCLRDAETYATMARTNLARVFSAVGRNPEAIEQLKSLAEPSFESQCILALAYFKDEKYQESFTAYDTAWHWLAQDDAQKSNILVAKAAMAYMFQGPEGAKSLLFKCAQLKPISLQGLFASCALGMLHKDLQLSKLVLKELQPYVDDPQYMADIALFQAYTHFLQHQWTESIRGLSQVIHRHPDHAALWLALAVLLLNMYPDAPAKASATCAGAALSLGRSTMDTSKVQALVALSHLQAGHARRSILEAQRAVHMYPDRTEGWAVLIAAVLPRVAQKSKNQAIWLSAIIGLVRRRQECTSRALSQWLSNNERKATLLCEQLN